MGKQDVFGLDRGNSETWMSSAEGKPNKPVEKIAKKHDFEAASGHKCR